MTIKKLLHVFHPTAPAVGDTERPVPRWIMRLAYAMPLLLLPACLWRLPFAFHFEMGQHQDGGMPALWLSIPYVFGLSVLSELVAFLCIGLVRGWGEVAPARLPFIGGRHIRPMAAVIPALLGGLTLTALFGSIPLGGGQSLTVFGIADHVTYDNGWWEALAMTCTAPLPIWGPVVVVLAIAYYVRRRPRPGNQTPAPGSAQRKSANV
ncbi:hypothetical protein [Nocardioides sp. NPDC006273]|uniref:hypothetical protein n=1 Tax=Nocardioides sp. NPDC006273 TaxID=3155598 RepID=UPI0033B33012